MTKDEIRLKLNKYFDISTITDFNFYLCHINEYDDLLDRIEDFFDLKRDAIYFEVMVEGDYPKNVDEIIDLIFEHT